MSVTLTSQAMPRAALSAAELEAMHALFTRYFAGSSAATFRRDLEQKNWVILLRDETGELRGFSTLLFYTTQAQGQTLSVVYSGDTIIQREYWGTPELPRSWIKTVLQVTADMPQPVYWLLISSGYKTYRFLSVFYKSFYPRCDTPTPPETQALMDQLAQERFGTDYDPARGVVRFADGATPLKEGVAEVDEERLRDPHIAFFVARNPGHIQGDELVCLTWIHPDNFTPAGRRMVR
jgi:hypothetical protein